MSDSGRPIENEAKTEIKDETLSKNEILAKKNEILKKIFFMTMDVNISGRTGALPRLRKNIDNDGVADKICEDYIALYEERAKMIEEIKMLDKSAGDLSDERTRELIADIGALDKGNGEAAAKLAERVKSSIRLINVGKTARHLYER